MAPSLFGPPQINRPLPTPNSAAAAAAAAGDAFMDEMLANFNKLSTQTQSPPMGLTENMSPTFLSSGNPCLDFFFHVVPDTPPENLTQRLQLAWAHDPKTALKLVCNLRGVRGTGKSDKEGFYAAALWLHHNHPKTLACNAKGVAKFGYFKDLPEILFRLLEGLEIRKIAKQERESRSKKFKSSKRRRNRRGRKDFTKSRSKSTVSREERIQAEAKKVEIRKEKAGEVRHEKIVTMARRAVDRYNRDPEYRFLHDRISEVFADTLVADLEFLKSGQAQKISLASKWCPSLDSSFDRSTLLCESIAKRVFPRESDPEYESIEEAHYAYRVRDRLRKQVLVPLRQALELPEIYISSNRWNLLPYERVASVAMKNYKKLFKEHDQERFDEYLSRVKSGKAKIAAGALLPHQIIASLSDEDGSDNEVAELQWLRMVEDLSKKGKLKNCLAVCDVSGSMSGTPLQVCIALGLLTSCLSEDPWKNRVITFSHDPRLHTIQGDNLKSKMESLEQMDWEMNTDFQKVFDLILKVAVDGNLSEEQIIKRVLVFSDMEFDEASANDWETDYEAIRRKFRENGYERAVPEIVFWNLRHSSATPVPAVQSGVALVSGFSKNLLKLFLDGGGVLNPEAVMAHAISGAEYEKLVVLD
ncbi:hypothetical protein Sjap_023206 [Stephania japonica]|uniref:Uncharacterized protein n=1 Tax=Stephania japonica TaxID=461633 RepID=A0AAP0HK90_9MAGN